MHFSTILVQVVKYRKKVLEDGVVDLLKQKVREISGSFGGWKF